MTNLYIITGPAGVGKSTISKKLAQNLKKSVLIEGDLIYHQVIGSYVSAWQKGNHLDVFWDICINMIKIYLSYNYDVVFNYIISPDIINKIKSKFDNHNINLVVLLADANTILERDHQRSKDCQMGKRCITLLNNFKNSNFNSNNIINTTNLSIDEIVSIIQNNMRFKI